MCDLHAFIIYQDEVTKEIGEELADTENPYWCKEMYHTCSNKACVQKLTSEIERIKRKDRRRCKFVACFMSLIVGALIFAFVINSMSQSGSLEEPDTTNHI